jgi:hypothetical protein
MLAGSIANDKLANSTISGIALGSNLAALSAGNYLTGSDYDGSTIRTFNVDATTTNTVSKVVARDASGNFAAGTITATLNGNVTGDVTGNVSGSAGSVAAANITGTTLASNVVTSSLTSVGTLTNLTVLNTITGSVSGNAGTVTNGVYTTDTGTVTNTMLANSTISGIALGSNLAALTAGTYLTSGGTYNGGTARTFAVDATTAATASKVVARDSNGAIAATGTILAIREAGSFGAGQTITINMATDHYVHATVTAETVTLAYTNITAGKQVMIFFTNSTGADIAVNSGLADTNCTNAKGTENVKRGGTSRFGAVSFGTSTATMYGNWEK